MNEFYEALLAQLSTPKPVYYYFRLIFLTCAITSMINATILRIYSRKLLAVIKDPTLEMPKERTICSKCVTFWFILGACWDPFTAAIIAGGVVLLDGVINSLTSSIKL